MFLCRKEYAGHYPFLTVVNGYCLSPCLPGFGLSEKRKWLHVPLGICFTQTLHLKSKWIAPGTICANSRVQVVLCGGDYFIECHAAVQVMLLAALTRLPSVAWRPGRSTWAHALCGPAPFSCFTWRRSAPLLLHPIYGGLHEFYQFGLVQVAQALCIDAGPAAGVFAQVFQQGLMGFQSGKHIE